MGTVAPPLPPPPPHTHTYLPTLIVSAASGADAAGIPTLSPLAAPLTSTNGTHINGSSPTTHGTIAAAAAAPPTAAAGAGAAAPWPLAVVVVARWVVAYAHALKSQLTDDSDLEEELRDMLSPEELQLLLAAHHRWGWVGVGVVDGGGSLPVVWGCGGGGGAGAADPGGPAAAAHCCTT